MKQEVLEAEVDLAAEAEEEGLVGLLLGDILVVEAELAVAVVDMIGVDVVGCIGAVVAGDTVAAEAFVLRPPKRKKISALWQWGAKA
jgi:hypothetical protein